MLVKPETVIGDPQERKDPKCPLCNAFLDFHLKESFGEGLTFSCFKCKKKVIIINYDIHKQKGEEVVSAQTHVELRMEQ